MPKKFDAANRHLLDAFPADWVAFAGLPRGSAVQVVDADLSAVSASADKLIRVDATPPYIAHFEPQAGPDRNWISVSWCILFWDGDVSSCRF